MILLKETNKKKEICTLPPINILVQIGSLPWGTKSKYQGPQVPNRILKVSKFIILISSSFIQTLMFCVKQTMGEMLTKLHFFIYVLCVNWKMAYMSVSQWELSIHNTKLDSTISLRYLFMRRHTILIHWKDKFSFFTLKWKEEIVRKFELLLDSNRQTLDRKSSITGQPGQITLNLLQLWFADQEAQAKKNKPWTVQCMYLEKTLLVPFLKLNWKHVVLSTPSKIILSRPFIGPIFGH